MMSSFVDEAINPKTEQTQEAWFIDDFYGQHQFAVAFRKDREGAVFNSNKIKIDEYDIYPLHTVKTPESQLNSIFNRSKQ
jgi:hypothetical protein